MVQQAGSPLLRDQRRPGERLRVDEVQDAPGFLAQIEEAAGNGPSLGVALQLNQGQGPGAVQVLQAGQIDGEPGGAQLLQPRLQFGLQGAEVIQGQPAGEGQGDLLAGFAGNADGVLGC